MEGRYPLGSGCRIAIPPFATVGTRPRRNARVAPQDRSQPASEASDRPASHSLAQPAPLPAIVHITGLWEIRPPLSPSVYQRSVNTAALLGKWLNPPNGVRPL